MKASNKFFFTAFLALMVWAGCTPDEAEHYDPSEDQVQEDMAVTEVDTPAENQVLIRDLTFVPEVLAVEQGTTVEWINLDDQHHTVVSAQDTTYFRSGNMVNGQTFTFTFDSVGVFEYVDIYYPTQMTGRIKVESREDMNQKVTP